MVEVSFCIGKPEIKHTTTAETSFLASQVSMKHVTYNRPLLCQIYIVLLMVL